MDHKGNGLTNCLAGGVAEDALSTAIPCPWRDRTDAAPSPPSTRGHSEASTGGHFDGLCRSTLGADARSDRQAMCPAGPAQERAGAGEGQSLGRSFMVTEPPKWYDE